MRIEQTGLQDCFIVHDTFFGDERGYFFESFNKKRFKQETGIDIEFVQDNQSRSKKGTLRGLHYQLGDMVQAKLVRVLNGKVLDVVVDLRKNSSSFGKHIAVELSGDSRTQLFVPRGFAHGFIVLSDEADFFYKCDNYYDPASEAGIIFNDPELGIDWKIEKDQFILSPKDRVLPSFREAVADLNF